MVRIDRMALLTFIASASPLGRRALLASAFGLTRHVNSVTARASSGFASRAFANYAAAAAAAGGGVVTAAARDGNRDLSSSSSSSALCMAMTASVDESVKDRLLASMEVTHPSYEVIEKDVVTEYGSYCVLYRHKKTGAELLSVATDDDNKSFGITFRTPPEDSTGVPHILEHSVLCGSTKYRTKDPFVRLLQGSLNTFLNAMTYPDRTCYVLASQNLKDFYNLVNVYADAVYNPRAVKDPNVHAQEGWHLELEKKEDPLVYKGVVYNEMKGVYSSPDSLLSRESMRSVFPETTYGVDSGGDPKKIPELSYEQFREFHEKFYHPANSRIYFSGDDDVLTRLEIMDGYLSEFSPSPESKPESEIVWQKKVFVEPKKEKHPYPVSGDQPELHMVNVNWLVNDEPLTSLEELTFSVLDHLLMATSSSTLYKALVESGLGAQVTGGGLMEELLQMYFSVGLKGVEATNVEEVEKLVMETLAKAAEEGFTDDDIAASLNTIEFQMREFNTGGFPKGLAWMLGSMRDWIYDKSPTEALKFEEPLAELKEAIATSGSKIFQDTIKKYLLDNTHRSTIELVPSKTLEEEEILEEKSRLEKIKSSLSDAELEKIIEDTANLKKLQAAEDSAEDIATIPTLSISDLTREQAEYPIEATKNVNDSGATLVKHELVSTSGIIYADIGFDMSGIPISELPLIGLFSRLTKEAGAGDLSDVALSRYIGTYTGGVDVVAMQQPVIPEGSDGSKVGAGNNMVTKLFLRGKATADNADKLFDIYNMLMTEAKLDSQKKAIEILKEAVSRTEASIQGSGHAFVNMRIRSRYSASAYIEEQMQGISYLDTVKGLLKQAEEDWPTLLSRLEAIRTMLIGSATTRDGIIMNLTGDEQVFKSIEPSVNKFLDSLPGESDGEKLPNFYESIHPWIEQARTLMIESNGVADEGFVVPTQVSYVGKGGLAFEEGEEVKGSAIVAARHLKTGYLWDYVRVIGGAYGGFCTFSQGDGIFSYLSYRDPNLADTIDVFDNAANSLMETAENMTEEELTKAIVGAIGDLDGSLAPDQKGWLSLQRWVKNESAEQRQKLRDEILATTKEDFKDFAQRLKDLKNSSVAVVSSKGAFEEAAKSGKEMKLIDVM